MNTMSTETILSAVPSLSEADQARAQRELRDGHLLVVPTDTVYGIGADAANPQAVAAVLAAKGRGRQMPPPVLVASVDAIDSLCVDVPWVKPAAPSGCACRTSRPSCASCMTSDQWPSPPRT